MKLNKNGFTLVELIIVIAIVAVLAVVGIPMCAGYITKAKDAAAAAEINNIRTAIEIAVAENGIDTSSMSDRIYINNGSSHDTMANTITDRVNSIVGTKTSKKYSAVLFYDPRDVGLVGGCYIYYTDSSGTGAVNGATGYTYYSGKITKGTIALPEPDTTGT